MKATKMLKKRYKDGRSHLNLSPWSTCVSVCVSIFIPGCWHTYCMCVFNGCELSHIPVISECFTDSEPGSQHAPGSQSQSSGLTRRLCVLVAASWQQAEPFLFLFIIVCPAASRHGASAGSEHSCSAAGCLFWDGSLWAGRILNGEKRLALT